MATLVLDSSAVSALAEEKVEVLVFVNRARTQGDVVVMPTVVIAEVTRDRQKMYASIKC